MWSATPPTLGNASATWTPDHLDQPPKSHLGAARTAATLHRTLRETTHPRCPVGHPDRPGRHGHIRGAIEHYARPPLWAHRRRADHRTGLSVVWIFSQPNRTG